MFMDLPPSEAAVFFDEELQVADLSRQVSGGTARTPDVVNFWQGHRGGDEGAEVGSKAGSSSIGGIETPKVHWTAAKVSVEELYSKLSNVQEKQRAEEVAKVKVSSATERLGARASSDASAPFPVGLVLREPRLAPIRVPEPVRPPSTQQGIKLQSGQSPSVPPPPLPPPGLERPQRAPQVGGNAALAAAGTNHRAQVPVVSIGTVGHPTKCAEPCLEEFCSKGLACPLCHLCGAQRIAPPPPSAPSSSSTLGGAEQGCPSVGSVGHPHACAEACKFHSKGKGCKDGANCIRCHVCRWSRHSAKKR